MFFVRRPLFQGFALVMALIAIVSGVYITFFESRGYVKTQATIVSIQEDEERSTAEDKSYIVMVDYIAEGSHHTSPLDMYSGTWKVGQTVTVYYDPNHPSVVHGGRGFGIYLMGVGVAMIAILAFAGITGRRTG